MVGSISSNDESQSESSSIAYSVSMEDTDMHLGEDTPLDPLLIKLIEAGNVARIDGEVYYFVNKSIGWVKSKSTVAAKAICEECGFNAPVNFVISTAPIVSLLDVDNRVKVATMPLTFTQGNIRCMFYYDHKDRMILAKACPLNMTGVALTGSVTKSTFCILPGPMPSRISSISMKPMSCPVDKGPALAWIVNSFGENWKTILWMAGDIMADFGDKRAWILYGPGKTGKSKTMEMIKNATSGTIMSLDVRFVTSKRRSHKHFGNTLSDMQLHKAMSTRLITCNDLEINSEDEELNIQTIKLLTGGDVSERGIISVTTTMFANKLHSYDNMWEYTRSDRTRRIVVVPSVTVRTVPDAIRVPSSKEDLLPILAGAIRIRAMYSEKPPLTLTSVLHTLFMDGAKDAMSVVKRSDNASFMTCLCATHMLCRYFTIQMDQMQQCLSSLCYEGVSCMYGVYAISDIEPIVGFSTTPRPDADEKKRLKKERDIQRRNDDRKRTTMRSYMEAAKIDAKKPEDLF